MTSIVALDLGICLLCLGVGIFVLLMVLSALVTKPLVRLIDPVQAIIAVARNLDMTVLVEGIETEEVLNRLWRMGCRKFFGRARVSAERKRKHVQEATLLLSNRKPGFIDEDDRAF